MSEALKKELVFYGSYHSDAVNKLIHAICVPLLLWTGQKFNGLFPLNNFLSSPGQAMLSPVGVGTLGGYEVTVSALATSVYILYYIYLYPALGMITLPILSGMGYSAHLFWTLELDNKWTILIGVHGVSWIAQFVGHGKFEGRRPALMDSLLQAFLTAPFFVFFEYCFFFGLFQDLHHEIQREGYSAHLFWTLELDNKWTILIGVHGVSWIAQFVGHGKFEGRRPALMDSLLQAFLTAPFFVFFEYCFFFGLFQDLHHEIQREVYKEIARKRQ
eukprot:sb/3468097/